MLERIESPDAVLAFRAVGKIDKSDYDNVLEPAVYAMLAQHGELRFVYVLGDECFAAVLNEVPALAQKLLAALARRLRQADTLDHSGHPTDVVTPRRPE